MRIDIPISGFDTAVRRQALRANNIANVNTPGYRAIDAAPQALAGGGAILGPAEASTAFVPTDGSNVDLVDEQTGTLLNLRSAQASAGVVRAEDQLLGETIDLLA